MTDLLRDKFYTRSTAPLIGVLNDPWQSYIVYPRAWDRPAYDRSVRHNDIRQEWFAYDTEPLLDKLELPSQYYYVVYPNHEGDIR